MAKVSPWHSAIGDRYHDDDRCTEGNNIETKNRRSGTGGLKQCLRCKELGG